MDIFVDIFVDVFVDILWTMSTVRRADWTLVRSLQFFLRCVVCRVSDHFRVVCKHKCAVFFLINQTKFRVKTQRNAHSIGRKPLAIIAGFVDLAAALDLA